VEEAVAEDFAPEDRGQEEDTSPDVIDDPKSYYFFIIK
jgi:hypothetical protein